MTLVLAYGHALAINAVRLCLWLVMLTAIFVPLEHVFTLPADSKGRRGSLWVDLGYYFLNSMLPAVVLSVPLGILTTGTRAVLPHAYVGVVSSLPLWAKLALGLVVGELGGYWGHRWTHSSKVLWRFHAVHHAPERLHFLINTHAHPVDIIFIRLCSLTPLYALGLADAGMDRTALVPVLVTVLGTLWAFFIHADLRWRLGPFEWLIATPAFHHWHHTNDHNRDRNFAALLPVLDRLFGTHHLPHHWPPCYGIDKPPQPLLSLRGRRQPSLDTDHRAA